MMQGWLQVAVMPTSAINNHCKTVLLKGTKDLLEDYISMHFEVLKAISFSCIIMYHSVVIPVSMLSNHAIKMANTKSDKL